MKSILINLIHSIKKAFTFVGSSHYIYECLNCKEKFDGNKVEYFIKHQIDCKHYEYTKYKKIKNSS